MSQTSNHLPQLAESFLAEARAERAATVVALDIDGTISEIAPTPRDAFVSTEMLDLLRVLSRSYRIVIVTGRDIPAARALAPLRGATYIGSHGMETARGRKTKAALDRRPLVRKLRALVDAVVRDVPEVAPYVERKRWSASFHYRLVTRREVVERLKVSVRAHLPEGLKIREGKKLIEAVPGAAIDKGTALRAVVLECGARRVLAMGDDVTDIAMFRALGELRERGLAVLRVAVTGDETPRELLSHSDAPVAGVAGSYELLCRLQ